MSLETLIESNLEVTFHRAGNTIVGNYSAYAQLDKAIQAKSVFVPEGYTIKANATEFRRLVEHVELFGHCIKSKAAFVRACGLAGVMLLPPLRGPVALASGRIVTHSRDNNGATCADMQDGGNMSESEWEEYCGIVKRENGARIKAEAKARAASNKEFSRVWSV